MFWLLIKLVLYSIACLVCLVVGRELISLYNLHYYKKQGVKTEYLPLIGGVLLQAKRPGYPDHLVIFKEFLERHKQDKLVAMNFIFKEGLIYLLDDDMQREFFLKEIDCTIKNSAAAEFLKGLFFQNGEEAFRKRAFYGKFFNLDNIKILSKRITLIVQTHLDNYIRDHFQGQSTSKRVFIKKDLLFPILGEILHEVLLGDDKTPPKYKGKDFEELCINFLEKAFQTLKSPLVMLMGSVPIIGARLPAIKSLHQDLGDINDFIFDQYTKSKKRGPKDVPNILGLLAEMDQEGAREGRPQMSKEEIGGECLLFYSAGIDTSLNTTVSSLVTLAENPNVQERFQEMAAKAMGKPIGQTEYEDYNSDEQLDDYMNEFFRLGSPVAILPSRMAIKDFTLGGIKIKKGTWISIPGTTVSTRFWEDADKFDGERLSKKNRKSVKMAGNMPFGNGRRMCIGRMLGDLMVRNLLLNIVKRFRLSDAEGGSKERSMTGLYKYECPEVVLELRK